MKHEPTPTAHLEERLQRGVKPELPEHLHADIMQAIARAQRPAAVIRRPWRPLMAAAAAAVILLAWHPVERAIRVRHLTDMVEMGNQRLSDWLNHQPINGPEALQQENEMLMADLQQGASFLFRELPFDAAVLAATQTQPGQGGHP